LEGRLLNQYERVAQLGQGGMGVVYRARDRELGREVAIKLLPPELATDPDRLARLEREARTLAAVSHPGIATLFGLGQAEIDGRPVRFLAMKLIEGEDLATRLARVGALDLEEASALGRQIAAALEVATRPVSSIATSSRPTYGSRRSTARSSSTSGWRSRSASIRAAPQARR
jgi:serine/threonine protein kinase